jgi:hypothetical protein
VKGDFQFTNRTRLSTRFTDYHQYIPGSGGGATTHVSGATEADRRTRQLWNQFTQVLGSNTVNEIKGGYFDYNWGFTSLTKYKGGAFPNCPLQKPEGVRCGSTRYQVRGYTIGTATNQPQYIGQDSVQVRDDFTFAYNAAGATMCGWAASTCTTPSISSGAASATGISMPRGEPPLRRTRCTRCSRCGTTPRPGIRCRWAQARFAIASRWAISTCRTSGTRLPRGGR